jgi:dephospho-CoA kinase
MQCRVALDGFLIVESADDLPLRFRPAQNRRPIRGVLAVGKFGFGINRSPAVLDFNVPNVKGNALVKAFLISASDCFDNRVALDTAFARRVSTPGQSRACQQHEEYCRDAESFHRFALRLKLLQYKAIGAALEKLSHRISWRCGYTARVKILGLTGDIACGKSTVAALLENFGASVLDADVLVHELYADLAFASQVAALFPARVLDARGAVDRKALGKVVFGDAAALRQLEALVHPAVATLRAEKLRVLRAQKPAPQAVVIEAVKLIESGQATVCEEVWCVTSTPEIQLRRLMEARALGESEARARLQAQPSREAKRARMEYSAPGVPLVFIENNASLQELRQVVEAQWRRFISPHNSPSQPHAR